MALPLNMSSKAAPSKPGAKVQAGRVNTIGVSLRELNELLDMLEAEERQRGKSQRRKFTRLNYRREAIQVSLVQPGGTQVQMSLASNNLSRGGIGLLHNSFVYTGTKCHVTLINLLGQRQMLSGTVTFCGHRTGNLHELGIKFNSSIVLRSYIDERSVTEFHEYEVVDASKLTGNVLLVESDAKSERLVKSILNETMLKINVVRDAAAAMAESSEDYVMVIVNEKVGETQGLTIIEQLRELGRVMPAILMTTNSSEVLASGITNVSGVTNPPSAKQLLSRFAERLFVQTPEGSQSATKAA